MITGTITAKPQVFAAAVKWAAKFVSTKPNVPVQGGLRLTAAGGTLTIESYNEHVEARATLPVGGDGEGAAIVSGRLLDALVATFPDKPVEIGSEGDCVAITAGRWTGTMPVIYEEWPAADVLPPSPIGTVDGTAFADLVARSAVATSHDLSKQIALACVWLEFGDDQITALATDAYRAVMNTAPYRLAAELGRPQTALIIAEILKDAASAFIGPDEITVGMGPNVLALASPTRAVTIRQVAEQYPPAEAMPALLGASFPQALLVKVADLLGPMKRAVLMRDKDGPIAMVVGEGMVTVHAKADQIAQKGAEDVDADYTGPAHTLAFNPKYLADALASAPGEVVRIGFNESEQRPGRPWHVVLTVPGDDSWRHLLMPLKIPGK